MVPHDERVDASQERSAGRVGVVALLVVLAVAGALRLWDLGGQSLWIDEIESVSFADDGFVLSELRERGGPLEPPASHVLTAVSLTAPLGIEAAGRLPSVLGGVLEVLGVYLLARELFRRRDVALVAAAFLAVAPFAVRYAQEARYYTLFSAAHLFSWWLLVRALRGRDRRAWMWWGVGTGVLALTGPFFVFVVPLQLVVVAVVLARARERAGAGRDVAVALGVGALVAAPWYIFGAVSWVREQTWDYALAEPFERSVTIDGPLLTRSAYWLLGNSPSATVLVALLVGLVAAAPFVAGRTDRWVTLGVLAYLGVLTVAIAIAARISGTYFAFRRVEFFVPVLLMVAAFALVTLAQRLRRRTSPVVGVGVVGVVVVVVLALSGRAVLAYFDTEKTPWRALADRLEAVDPEATIVVGPFPEVWAARIDRALEWQGVDRELHHLHLGDPEAIPAASAGDVVWVTGAPPAGDAFDVVALEDPASLQVLAGDRSWGQIVLPLYVATSRAANADELREQWEAVRGLSPFAPAP